MRSLRRVIAPGEPWDLGHLDETERNGSSTPDMSIAAATGRRPTTPAQGEPGTRPISAGKSHLAGKGEAEGMSSPLRKSNPWLFGQQ
jgi:hypothetical protein